MNNIERKRQKEEDKLTVKGYLFTIICAAAAAVVGVIWGISSGKLIPALCICVGVGIFLGSLIDSNRKK